MGGVWKGRGEERRAWGKMYSSIKNKKIKLK